MIKIFYGDCVLLFSSSDGLLPQGFRSVPAGESFAKMLENLELYKQVAVVAEDPAVQYERFRTNFVEVDAAGGIVENPAGELLMIHRNGRWDLPKGHREEGEPFSVCARREVQEETGIGTILTEDAPAHTTHHFYWLKGEWIMKKTEWFRMQAVRGEPVPQTVEGISSVEWVPRGQVSGRAQSCFPSVVEVLETCGYV